MDEQIPAAEANRRFSSLLRGVRAGRRYVVTAHGRPIARLLPVEADEAAAKVARTHLMDRLERQLVSDSPPWRRDELYE